MKPTDPPGLGQSLGQLLARLRGYRSKADLCRSAGVDPSVYSRYESDERPPPTDDLWRLLSALDAENADRLVAFELAASARAAGRDRPLEAANG